MLAGLRRERGQELIEYALVLPVLLAVLLTIIQFALIIFSYNTISDAARTAARWGVIGTRSTNNLTGIENRAFEVIDAAGLSNVTVDATKIGSTIRVEVTYPQPLLPLIRDFARTPTFELRAVSTKQIELE